MKLLGESEQGRPLLHSARRVVDVFVLDESLQGTMDPLHGSQLRLLDTGGALTLVLERVDGDDALCTALVCTTFRDAVFAQTWHKVRPAEEQHGAKRLGTSVAGVASRAGRLARVRSLGDEAPGWVRRWDDVTCSQLARTGALEPLQWARANGCDWDARTCTYAAAEGHLEVLQWARTNGCDWDAWMCSSAAERGHMEVLQWVGAGERLRLGCTDVQQCSMGRSS